jgi:geranylgeranyl pyrophosphate synthase
MGGRVTLTPTAEIVADEIAQLEALLARVCDVEYPVLAGLLRHILATRGKRVRPLLLLAAGRLYDHRPAVLLPAAAAIELLHTATLIHDDLIDHATTRRGRPTLNTLTSGGATVLVGDYLFAQAASFATATGSIRVVRVFATVLQTICQGELRQIFSSGDWEQSIADYEAKIAGKTASLFAAAAEIGAILTRAPRAIQRRLRAYGHELGMAFQIADDILDLTGTEEELGKPVGSDLRQGTLTLPTLYALRELPADNPIIAYLQARDGAREDLLVAAIATIRDSSAIARATEQARRRAARARALLGALPPSPARDLLDALAEQAVARRA